MSGEQIKPGYKRTEVGVIPESWECKALQELTDPARPIGYGIVQTGKPVAGGIRCIRVVDMVGHIDPDRLITTSQEISQAYKRTLLRENDLVIALRGKIGAVAAITKELEGANLTRGVALLSISEKFNTKYLSQYLSSPAGKNAIEKNLNGSALQEIPIASLRKLPAIAPPLPEQRAIATALSDVDALLTKLDQLIAKKRDLKQATMQQLLTGQTRLPGFSGEWEIKRLGDVGFANWGNVEITKDYYCESGFTAYSASGADGLVSWYEHEGEGIVLSAIGAQCGKSWLATGRWTPIKNTIWIKGLHDKLNSSFLYWISQSPDFWPTRGQAQPFIALGDVRNALMSCPSLPEQIAITTILSEMDVEVSVLETRRNKTRALKQGMMQELLTGRIRLVSDEDGETK